MSDTVTTTIILLSEFSLAFCVIIIIFMINIIRRQQKDKYLVKGFIKHIQQTESERETRLSNLLNEAYGITDAEAGKTTQALISNEKSLYNNVIKSFLGQNKELITNLDKDVEALTKGYHDLALGVELAKQGSEETEKKASKTHRSVKVIKQQNKKLKRENKALQEKNAALQRQLNSAMKRMENMLKEYASMYAGGHNDSIELARKKMALDGKHDTGEHQSGKSEGLPQSHS